MAKFNCKCSFKFNAQEGILGCLQLSINCTTQYINYQTDSNQRSCSQSELKLLWDEPEPVIGLFHYSLVQWFLDPIMSLKCFATRGTVNTNKKFLNIKIIRHNETSSIVCLN